MFSFNPFIYSNNCYPITKKEKRIVKKLKSYLIKENYYDAKRLLSTLEKLVCRELKNICSELSTADDDSDEHLLVKARCLAYVQLLGSYPYATQKELYKSYDLELAKASYAEWSRIGIAFNILTNIPVL